MVDVIKEYLDTVQRNAAKPVYHRPVTSRRKKTKQLNLQTFIPEYNNQTIPSYDGWTFTNEFTLRDDIDDLGQGYYIGAQYNLDMTSDWGYFDLVSVTLAPGQYTGVTFSLIGYDLKGNIINELTVPDVAEDTPVDVDLSSFKNIIRLRINRPVVGTHTGGANTPNIRFARLTYRRRR